MRHRTEKIEKSSFRPRLNQGFTFASSTSFFSVLRMRTVYTVEIPMIPRIIGISLFIWLGGLPGGTCPTSPCQQPVLRRFCLFGNIFGLPVSIFEVLWGKMILLYAQLSIFLHFSPLMAHPPAECQTAGCQAAECRAAGWSVPHAAVLLPPRHHRTAICSSVMNSFSLFVSWLSIR